MSISWECPPPRRGAAGAWDRFVGPGATPMEIALQVTIPMGAAIVAPLHAHFLGVKDWTALHYLVCSLMALDLVGGAITNSTSAGKRWYHREGRGASQQIRFILLHLFQPSVVSWLYLGFNVQWVGIVYGYLLVAGTAVLFSPLHLQRPVASCCYLGGMAVSMYSVDSPAGMEWFVPVFYFKLLVSHLPREEPYRPH